MTTRTEAPALVVRRLIHAPAERVFRAWSDPAVAARWGWGKAYDTISVELDCRPGGAWRQEIRDRTTGETLYFDGVFREVEAGRSGLGRLPGADRARRRGPRQAGLRSSAYNQSISFQDQRRARTLS